MQSFVLLVVAVVVAVANANPTLRQASDYLIPPPVDAQSAAKGQALITAYKSYLSSIGGSKNPDGEYNFNFSPCCNLILT